MKTDLFQRLKIRPLCIGLIFALAPGSLPAAERPAPDKTIVLDESQIKGAGSVSKESAGPKESLPALSLTLPWEGEIPEGDPNIALEIFRQLSQPNPSYFIEDQLKSGLNKGDKNGNR